MRGKGSIVVYLFGMVVSSAFALCPIRANAANYVNHIQTQRTGPAKCLGVHEDDLTHPFMAPCANFVAQLWSIDEGSNGYLKFRSKRTGDNECLGVAAADNSKIVVASCGNFKNQSFRTEPSKVSGYLLVHSDLTGSGLCLGIAEAGGAVDLDMRPCGNFPGQNWRFQP